METLDCIKKRRSIRKYKNKLVPWDLVSKICELAKFAPSAGNLMNWRLIVVTDPDDRKRVAEACFSQRWMEQASVHIAIVVDHERAQMVYGTRGLRLYSIQNAAALAMQILLSATDLGLGSCWVGAFDESKIRDLFNYPESFSTQAIITIGYADEHPDIPPRNRVETYTFMDAYLGKRRIPPMGYYSLEVEKAVRSGKKKLDKAIESISDKILKKKNIK